MIKQVVFPIIEKTQEFIITHWFKGVVLLYLILLFNQKDISFQIQFNEPTRQILNFEDTATPVPSKLMKDEFHLGAGFAGLVQTVGTPAVKEGEKEIENKANNFNNISAIISPLYLKSKGVGEQKMLEMRENCIKYVRRFATVAQTEMRKFGIPASIKLAQALLESDAGFSRLARKNNNHFGMKCFSKSCTRDHCSNFTDDTHKDFFRKYNNAWESFRAHSLLLQGSRYQSLKKFGTTDYRAWARGLKKAGYATDKRYAEKLIEIIEKLGLEKLDG